MKVILMPLVFLSVILCYYFSQSNYSDSNLVPASSNSDGGDVRVRRGSARPIHDTVTPFVIDLETDERDPSLLKEWIDENYLENSKRSGQYIKYAKKLAVEDWRSLIGFLRTLPSGHISNRAVNESLRELAAVDPFLVVKEFEFLKGNLPSVNLAHLANLSGEAGFRSGSGMMLARAVKTSSLGDYEKTLLLGQLINSSVTGRGDLKFGKIVEGLEPLLRKEVFDYVVTSYDYSNEDDISLILNEVNVFSADPSVSSEVPDLIRQIGAKISSAKSEDSILDLMTTFREGVPPSFQSDLETSVIRAWAKKDLTQALLNIDQISKIRDQKLFIKSILPEIRSYDQESYRQWLQWLETH